MCGSSLSRGPAGIELCEVRDGLRLLTLGTNQPRPSCSRGECSAESSGLSGQTGEQVQPPNGGQVHQRRASHRALCASVSSFLFSLERYRLALDAWQSGRPSAQAEGSAASRREPAAGPRRSVLDGSPKGSRCIRQLSRCYAAEVHAGGADRSRAAGRSPADRREIIASRWSSRRSCCRSQKENLLGLGSREVMR